MPGYVKFTGDYSKLKTIGYKFQKLYASNYMQWNKGDLRVWRKGSDITHDEFNLYDFLSFMRTNPELRTMKGYRGGVYRSYLITIDDENNTTCLPYTAENSQLYFDNIKAWHDWDEESGEPAPIQMYSKCVNDDLMEQLKELEDLGWYELVDGDMQP